MKSVAVISCSSLLLLSLTAWRAAAITTDSLFLSKAIAVSLNCIDTLSPHDPYLGAEKQFKNQHPAFYGCWDWHASVFNHLALLRVITEFPNISNRGAIAAKLDSHFSEANLSVELSHLGADPDVKAYETAWFLRLAGEVHLSNISEAKAWVDRFTPLEAEAIRIFLAELKNINAPNHTMMHQNTAFAMINALDYADAVSNVALAGEIRSLAKRFYLHSQNCQVSEEAQFHIKSTYGIGWISTCYVQADLMRRVLKANDFQNWFARFFPTLPDDWLNPLMPLRDYGYYRVGLMLQKAISMRGIAESLSCDKKTSDRLLAASGRQIQSAQGLMYDFEYMGDHWLPAFAIFSILKTRLF